MNTRIPYTFEELFTKCFHKYTYDEMKQSLLESENQIKEGHFRVIDNNFMDELRKKHGI